MNDLGVTHAHIVYNSPYRQINHKTKYGYFHEKFNIPSNTKIVLAIGSLITQHYIYELAQTLLEWPENIVLVLHGWFADENFRNKIMALQIKYEGKLYISTEIFSAADKYIPYLSSDIIFVGFRPDNHNLRLSAGSAGKLFDAMMCGKPVLAYDSPGMRDLVEINNIGVVFDHQAAIPESISEIMKNLKHLSINSLDTFKKYEFANKYKEVMLSIDQQGQPSHTQN